MIYLGCKTNNTNKQNTFEMNVPTIQNAGVIKCSANINPHIPKRIQVAIGREDNQLLFRNFETVPFIKLMLLWSGYNSPTDFETHVM